jgi:hypothetical protein
MEKISAIPTSFRAAFAGIRNDAGRVDHVGQLGGVVCVLAPELVRADWLTHG